MWFCLLVLLLGLSRTRPAGAGLAQPPDWYDSTSQQPPPPQQQQQQQPSAGGSHAGRTQRSLLGPVRVSGPPVLGGRLTISTLPDNVTRVVEDSGKYYTWRSFGPGEQRTHDLWVDMNDASHGQVRVHAILSNSYKQAVKVALSFDFPFYGHYLRQITIATGGFIFTGAVTHRMLTATQYIAPVMANFDPSFSKDSTVQYLDNGQVFVVQWGRVTLAGRDDIGAFTFQAALHKTGVITFSYRDIPRSLDVLSTAEHPVKAGLSDAFMVLSSASQSADPPQNTIYEYHRVEIDTTKITNSSAVEFTPLPTCLQHSTCELCLSANEASGCSWCNVLQRCSDGMDRHRQEWIDYACAQESKYATCEDYGGDSSVTPQSEPVTPPQNQCRTYGDTQQPIVRTGADAKADLTAEDGGSVNTAVIAGIVAALVLLLALLLLALYISCHPPSAASPLYIMQRRHGSWRSLKFQKQPAGYREVEKEGRQKDSIVEAVLC